MCRRLSISLNIDHMKYVMVQNQTASISGQISNSNSVYSGTYNAREIKLTKDFLEFEHTDGLNYISMSLDRYFPLISNRSQSACIGLIGGIGAGCLIPRSNILFLNDGTDEFHLAGYGFSGHAALVITLYNRLEIQYKVKSGFINLPDIVVNGKKNPGRASQRFWFIESMGVIGAVFILKTNN